MDRLMVFTVTSTGYPIQSRYGIYPKPSELAMYHSARIIRLTYQMFSLYDEKKDEEGKVLDTVDMYIHSGKDAINEKCTERTGITRDWMEKQTCQSIKDFSDRFFAQVSLPCPIVCYNASLNVHLFASELYRHGLHTELRTLMGLLPNIFCLMQQSIEICKIPSERKSTRYKVPSLFEISRCLFGAIQEQQQNNLQNHDENNPGDRPLRHIQHVAQCFFHLKNMYESHRLKSE